jgi:outer membrane protein OmpA-like peptidoglycan-associated protein
MQQALQTREQYDLHGLNFGIDKAALKSGAQPLLDDIATALKNFPDRGLIIVGHTDASGSAETNQRLSLERADAVKAGLVERGIGPGRLQVAGAGQMPRRSM